MYSWNEFKKNPGSAGSVVQLGTGNPKPGVKVQLISPTKTVVGTATTDTDGVWNISYKHTGKAANYTVKLPDMGLQQTITLKANGFRHRKLRQPSVNSAGRADGRDNAYLPFVPTARLPAASISPPPFRRRIWSHPSQ